jgi:phage terminase large subunit-like protein
MKLQDKQALNDWDQFKKQVEKSTFIDTSETLSEQKKRIAKLEANPEEWFKYYFPNFYKSKPAPFHIAATKRWLANNRWYEVRAWSRELAKSTRAMMEDLFLMLTGKAKLKILVSYSEGNAIRLLKPYIINLESNQRIINDYGEQKKVGDWNESLIVTKTGFSIIALGAGQSPRGLRLEDVRPDIIDVDDVDTDEECRNAKIVKQKFEWFEQALIPTTSVSGNRRIRINGNVIAKYCVVTEAMKKANHVDVINIRDKNGKSTWPAKNTEKDIDAILSIISYISAQKEYFNNPISEGTVFKKMHYKHMPPLSSYKFLVCYVDLSYKAGTKNDYKAATLVGKWKDEYHIIKAYVKQGTTSQLAEGMVEIEKFVDGKVPVYWIAEENFLQDIILKELRQAFTQLGSNISIVGDNRKKPDKITRIEATLEPLNRNEKLFLNEAERSNSSMQTLEEQFLALEPGSRTHDDAPDAVEGAKHIIDKKHMQSAPMKIGQRQFNTKKY